MRCNDIKTRDRKHFLGIHSLGLLLADAGGKEADAGGKDIYIVQWDERFLYCARETDCYIFLPEYMGESLE